MELIFIVTIAAAIGVAIALSPLTDRLLIGIGLIIALTVAVSAVIWTLLLWFGLPSGGWLMWTVPLLAGAVSGALGAVWLSRSRASRDEARFEQLLAAQR